MLTSVVDLWCGGSGNLGHGAAHVQLNQSQLIHEVRQLREHTMLVLFYVMKQTTLVINLYCGSKSARNRSYSDSAQLLLYLVGHLVGPVLLSQEVPEDSTN